MKRGVLWGALGLVSASVAAAAVGSFAWETRLVTPLAESACGCTRDFFLVHPIIFVAGSVLALFFAAVSTWAFVRVGLLIRRTRERHRTIASHTIASIDAWTSLCKGGDVAAVTIGFFHPHTFVGDAFWRGLSPEERAVVLLHEAEHRRRFDPAVRACLAVIHAFVGWVPGVTAALRAEETFLEIRADAAAAQVLGTVSVRRALDTASRMLGHAARFDGAVVGFVPLEDRLAHGTERSIARTRRTAFFTMCVSLLIALATLTAVRSWAGELPGAQCVAFSPVCVASLPNASEFKGEPASVIRSVR